MRYVSKPIQIDAMRLTTLNAIEVMAWMTNSGYGLSSRAVQETLRVNFDRSIFIDTLKGTMKATPGDWIIRGTEGEFYPCKDSVFRRKYELLNETHVGKIKVDTGKYSIALGLIDDIYKTALSVEVLDENGDREKFAASVVSKAEDMEEMIRNHVYATDAQVIALRNMLNGLSAWV